MALILYLLIFFNVNCLKMDLDLFIFYCQYLANACYILDVQNVLTEGSKEEKKEWLKKKSK